MILYIIRHGAPDYATDSLLDEGRRQAQLVAARLKVAGIDAIYASPMGRARETAQPLAEMLGLPVMVEEWAHEIGSESATPFPDGVMKPVSHVHPVHYHRKEYLGLPTERVFGEVDGFRENDFRGRYRIVADGLVDFLARLGYRRNENGTFDIVAENDRHVALFCHGGMLRIVISFLFDLPIHLIAASQIAYFTGVTTLSFGKGYGNSGVTLPKLLTLGDIGHLYNDGHPLNFNFTGDSFRW